MRHVLLRGAVSSAMRRDLDRVGGGEEDVRNDGASSRSGSVRQKVGRITRRAVHVWKHEEAMEKLGEYAAVRNGGSRVGRIG